MFRRPFILRRGLGFERLGGIRGGPLTPEQKQLAEEFRRGIAQALGVPPEAIRQEPIERWVRRWTEAFVKPGFLGSARDMGYEISHEIIKAYKRSGRDSPL